MLYDWLTYFYPQLENPWQLQDGIFNLPWVYVILHPLTYLGPYLSVIIIQIATLISIWYICQKMHVPPFQRVLIYLSPPVIWGTFIGQFDGIILLAYFLPFWVAPISVLIKPQVNIGAIRRLIPIWPFLLAAVIVISAFIIWEWPFAVQFPNNGQAIDTTPRGMLWNWSFWPYGLLLAPMLIFSRDIRIRMGISPFLFPYCGVHSLLGPLIALSTSRLWLFLLAWLFMWIRWWIMVNTGAN